MRDLDDGAREALRAAARERLAIVSLADFVRLAWEHVEPAPLAWNWHLDVLAHELEAVDVERRAGRAAELVICIPPGHAKSLVVSVFWPAWQWLREPALRGLYLANDGDLVKRDSRRTRDLLTSPFYAALKARASREFGIRGPLGDNGDRAITWSFRDDQNEVINFGNDLGGHRQCKSIGSTVTGKRADQIVIDDPYDAKEVAIGSPAQVARRMRAVVDVYDAVLSSRLNDKRAGARVLIMQRLHGADLAGALLDRPGVRRCILSTEYVPDALAHPLDPRGNPDAYRRTFGRDYTGPTGEGALLFPSRFDAPTVARAKVALGARHYAAQEQQRPIVSAGSVFKRAAFRRYPNDPQRFAVDEVLISVDCTFRASDSSDYVVFTAWGRVGAKRYLLDVERDRMTYTETRARLIRFRAKWSRATAILVEAKANGDALIDDLAAVIPGIIPYDPGNLSKEARAELAAVYVEAGNVYLPDARYVPGVVDFEAELIAFPNGLHDDQVDSTSQALIRWGSTAMSDPAREFGFLLGTRARTR